MAPLCSKTRKASDSSTSSVPRGARNLSPSARTIATKTGSPTARTPERMMNPIQKRRKAITQAQKQALIDNLQLEISERARKLRAQYSLQAQGLRTRIEIRVNRIPLALRKVNIGELLAKYSREQGLPNAATKPVAETAMAGAFPALKGAVKSAESKGGSSPSRGTKRYSDEISCDADKENDSNVDLALPKKRTKAAVAPARIVSRSKPATSQVLSPKSYNSNSKNLLRSPIRPNASPPKSNIARPVSPLKSVAPAPAHPSTAPMTTGVIAGMVEKIKSTRTVTARKVTPAAPAPAAGAGRAKRTAAQPAPASIIGRGRAASNSSHASVSTTGTVITRLKGKASAPVQKAEAGNKAKSTAGRTGGLKAVAKKAAAASVSAAAAVEVPAAGRRILRKRK
ncbi:hypothetical protein FGG08_004567 [Glutinoglossum americanum]|uniref:Borealin N-terminal domain-containing protein n=1 Tax=Glutinoglossum americanum TaxID=1670608 RepID=A0A9P8I5E4_9PEZI|nr:hypothetical protein FGG08_004567 [Glutinoglossum americanum]